jgi:hypothetical protein
MEIIGPHIRFNIVCWDELLDQARSQKQIIIRWPSDHVIGHRLALDQIWVSETKNVNFQLF